VEEEDLDARMADTRAAMDEDRASLLALTDSLARAKRIGELINDITELTAEYSQIRREALEDLLHRGMKQSELARELGLSSARMSKLIKTGPPPERAFFGVRTKPLTVAVGQKRESDKAKPGPVVAQEDFLAYEHLREFTHGMGLRTHYEVICPPGIVNLNRDGLVIICGPRLSPLIAQVLESDRRFAFDKDAEGRWYLMDRDTGTVHRSPEDSDQPGDIAYLGRLPRPDGRGDFLYIAGIHAAGAAGVVHYLENNLAELYQQVRTRRFSALIACEYDPQTREVTSSELLTSINRGEA
jgi:hypothetical protein